MPLTTGQSVLADWANVSQNSSMAMEEFLPVLPRVHETLFVGIFLSAS
jgi:hypothetical protein